MNSLCTLHRLDETDDIDYMLAYLLPSWLVYLLASLLACLLAYFTSAQQSDRAIAKSA